MTELLMPTLQGMIAAFLVGFLPLFLITLFVVYIRIKRYKNSQYYAQTGHGYWKVFRDIGLYGEYRCVAEIESRFSNPLILLNVYLPHPTKKDRTTEIDVLLIHKSGIHVIESKNYSGWIFGREQDRQWTQTLSNRKKFRFYNPIKQNELHMKAVEQFTQLDRSYLSSWIIFSDRSTLKKIDSPSVPVLNRKAWAKQLATVKQTRLTPAEQKALYDSFLPYTSVDEAVMTAHVDAIQRQKKVPLN